MTANESKLAARIRELEEEYTTMVRPTAPTISPEAAARKARPVCTGVLDYFPDALLAVAEVSRIGNDQHNPGQPLHWDKSKSKDEADALMRHLLDRGTKDTDGTRHSAKVAWRALALLQREIDAERAAPKVTEFRLTVRLPVQDTNGDIYDFRETDLDMAMIGVTIRDAAHGLAVANDFAQRRYLGRVVTLWGPSEDGTRLVEIGWAHHIRQAERDPGCFSC